MTSLVKYSLSKGWSFKDSVDEDADAWMPVPTVPSVVQQDLQANDRLQDPFIGFNELNAKWVNEKSWTYRNIFHKPEVPQGSRIDLAFDGLDTFATVKLDGTVILESTNMFVGHRVDITQAIGHKHEHILEIIFDSAMLRARNLRAQDRKHKWASFNGDPARLSVRKAQYHWGWDWGPVLMTAGIWRDVRIEVYAARIEDLWADVHVAESHREAAVTAHVKVDTAVEGPFTLWYRLSLDGRDIGTGLGVVHGGMGQVAFDGIEEPSLWWPCGYGDPTLYDLSVSLMHRETELHHVSKKIGIRKVQVMQEPDKHGKSFFFRINGVDIFCGGSCWIPADSLLPRITPGKYRKWVELMVSGGQVMTRVWGGGIYEDDSFYNVCDELGVIVWQDFMFACGNYPAWPELLDSIREEAIYNVRRLRHHPSIVMYAGNNEDYQVQEQSGLTYDYKDKNPENWLQTDFPARYIYEKVLPEVVRDLTPHTFYHPGSPWGGGNVTSDPTVGDLHQWNVWHGTQEKYQLYEKLGGRFISEFGMQGSPYLKTIESFVDDITGIYPESHVLDFHNKAEGHERRIAIYLAENVKSTADLETYIYLTQFIQAEAMMYAYRGWRRQWGDKRRCGGALLWQLNDCWPGISWSIVDYYLRPKPAYYAVARALRPIAIGVQREHHDWSVTHAEPPKSSKYSLWVTSSLQKEIIAKVDLRYISVTTGFVIQRWPVWDNITIAPNGTTDIIVDNVIDYTEYPGPHILAARVLVDGNVVSRDFDWPQPFKYLNLSDRHVDGETVRKSDGEKLLRITAAKPIKGLVFQEDNGIKVSDNAMDIVPMDPQDIRVRGWDDGTTLKYQFVGSGGTRIMQA